MQLNFEQIRLYFERRHPGQRIPAREKAPVRCAFHSEDTPSCTLFLDGNGGFNCHACGAKGNLFQFEARFSSCSLDQAEILAQGLKIVLQQRLALRCGEHDLRV